MNFFACEDSIVCSQVINKTDLAPAVGADLKVMERDALRMRDGGPFVFAQVCDDFIYNA